MIKHGVKFGNIHSFTDLDLILAPFVLTPATPKLNILEIAGGDGSLDLTEALGEIRYKDREFKLTFTVNPSSDMTFEEKVVQVSNVLNGRRFNITFDRDDEYYWDGRISVNQYLQDKNLNQIVLSATVKPYKLKQTETEVTFDLTSADQEIILQNSRKSVVPEIICSHAGTIVTDGSASYVLQQGSQELAEIKLVEGTNTFKARGNGTITFVYREGVL